MPQKSTITDFQVKSFLGLYFPKLMVVFQSQISRNILGFRQNMGFLGEKLSDEPLYKTMLYCIT